MRIFNLPPVEANTLPPPNVAGEWVPIPLDALAGSLAIDEKQVRPDELRSIPDAWAQVQLTSDALLTLRHGARDAVIAQWRGLLALFALQPLLKSEYELRVTARSFNNKSRSATTLRGLLLDLLPVETLVDSLSWEHISLIEVISAGSEDAVLAGVTSPMTLLAPTRMASGIALSIPWLRNGLGDPTLGDARAELSPQSWPILVKYIDGLISALRIDVTPALVANRDKLIGHLEEYRTACMAIGGETGELKQTLISLEWPHPFYAPLGKAWLPERKTGSQCRVQLRGVSDGSMKAAISLFPENQGTAGAGKGSKQAGAILIDPAIAKTLELPASQIRAWNNYSLQDAQSTATLKVIREEAAKQNIVVLQPDDFFTPDLIRLHTDSTVPAHPPGFESALLPLAPIALLFAKSSGDLASRIRLQNCGGGDCEVALDLTLEDENGNDFRHTMIHAYPAASIARMPAPDDLALWPDFQSTDWPWTFLRFQYDPRTELQTRFCASAELIVRDVLGAEVDVRLQRLAEWSARQGRTVDRRLTPGRIGEILDSQGQLLLRSLRPADSDKLVSGHHETSAGVEAIFFCRKRSDREPNAPAGCVLVDRRQIGPGGEASTVAFDFGTTNTIAYAQVDSGEPKKVAFRNRVHFPVKHPIDEEIRASEYTSFFPIHPQDMPLPTVAKRREFEDLTAELRPVYDNWDVRVGFSHFAFFMPRPEQALASNILISLVDQGRLRFDLKWGEDTRLNFVVQSFLTELMMMTAAEIVESGGSLERIKWRFSYPQSFTPAIKSGFETAVRGAHAAMFGSTPEDSKKQALDLVTEGAAAAAYFIGDPEQQNKGRGKLMLMLDIGGGSTDMAIREDETLVWRGSVKLAGTDFFRRFLVNNFDLLEAFDAKAVRSLVDSKSAGGLNSLDRKRQLADLIVARRGFSEDFARLFAANAQNRLWEGLRQCSIVTLGGMIYYLGMVLRSLRDAGKICDEHLQEITVAFGGRGSSLFRQLDPHDAQRPELSDICALAVLPAGSDPDTAKIMPEFSLRPKEEVARGLLLGVIDAPLGTDSRRSRRDSGGIDRSLPVGLGLKAQSTVAGNSVDLAPEEFIPDLLDAKRVAEIDLGEFQKFLTGLRKLTGLTVDIATLGELGRLANSTRTKVNQSLAALRPEDREDGDAQTLEPPFITTLRLLVEIMSESIGERDKRVEVRQRK